MKLSPNKNPFHYSLGTRGENSAERHLIAQDYKILARNYRCPLGEIDLVAKKDKRYYFIEVKTRSSDEFGLPAEAVHLRKQKQLKRLAQWYLKENRLQDVPISFEVIAVHLSNASGTQIQHFRNAFEAPDEF